MKKIGLGILLTLVIVIGGAYYWNWYMLHHTAILSQPAAAESTGSDQNAEPTVTSAGTVDNEKPETTLQGWTNILVLGTDSGENEVSRTDTMMLISVNVDTHQVSAISVPRDTRVNIPGVGLTKINHANVVGVLAGGMHQGTLDSAKAVSDLLGVTINYYVKIDFHGFEKAVDAVGGIDVNLPNPINDDGRKVHFPAGENHLSGYEALRLARTRYGLPNGDFDRQRDQFYLLSALAHQMLRLSNVPALPKELKTVRRDLIDTNLPTPEMLSLGLAFKGIDQKAVKYYQLPGKGVMAHDPLVGAKLYYYEPDMAGVKKVVGEALKLSQK